MSSEIIELGTITYPYKSMRAISSEILNIFSHLNVNITIYLKENASVYVSDYTNYFLNITSVKISSYSTNSSSSTISNQPSLIPTQINLPSVSKRTIFHILQNMDLNLYISLGKGTFTNAQQGMIITFKATFMIASSNFYIQNVNIKREYVDYNLIITFTQLVGLQKLWLDVRDVNFNLTGTAFVSYDPLNIYFDSLYIDTYGLRNFASMMIP